MHNYIAVHVTTGILLNLTTPISPFQRVTVEPFQSVHANLSDAKDDSLHLTVAGALNIDFDPNDPQQAFYIFPNAAGGRFVYLS